jgi:hypothetical protein
LAPIGTSIATGHDQVHLPPGHVVGEAEREGAGEDQRDAVAQRVHRHQRALVGDRRDLDAVGVDRDVLRGAGEGDQQGEQR